MLAATKSYLGFFSILWFTWLQVTLFHLRFGVDSAFERLCKFLHFGVMTGFAVVGPAYKTGWEADDKEAAYALRSFKILSIILMLSRLVLVIQYVWALINLRKYKRTTIPLIIHVVVLTITSGIFLGMFFLINSNGSDKCIIAWYVTIGIESGVICLVAGNWKFLSFRRTNIVERIGLLTLIILGEGIIGLCGSIQKVGNDQKWGADIVGLIICGIIIIYALWMLYFDQSEHDKVGTVRQQLWIIGHFPMHVTILFTIEGSAQLVVWRKLISVWYGLRDDLAVVLKGVKFQELDTKDLKELVTNLNETFHVFYHHFEEGVNEMRHKPDFTALHKNMAAIISLGNDTDKAEAANRTLEYIQESFASAAVLAGKNMGVEAPHHYAKGEVNNILDKLLDKTFGTVFTYFFIAAGLCLIMTAILFVLGRRHKLKSDYINVGLRIFVGIGLTLVSTMIAGGGNNPAFANYAESPWMLPTVAIALTIVVVADNLLRICTQRSIDKRLEAEKSHDPTYRA